MRDTRHNRLVLVLLLVASFALITVDIRGGQNSPLANARDWASTVFGPAERAMSAAVDPLADAVNAVKDAGSSHDERRRLREENAALRRQLETVDAERTRAGELDRLLRVASVGQYRIKPARVVAIGPAQGFSWTVTIDAGKRDGIAGGMTVINGDGLVGRVTTVGPMTATVLLAIDPGFSAGSRMVGSAEIGIATGQGGRPMKLQLLNGMAKVAKGDRLVTFGSDGGSPFVPGVPVGEVVEVQSTPGALTRTVDLKPYVNFTSLDTVGVVVEPPRTDPRDALLPPPPAPEAAPAAAPAPAPAPGASQAPAATPAPGAATASPGPSPANRRQSTQPTRPTQRSSSGRD